MPLVPKQWWRLSLTYSLCPRNELLIHACPVSQHLLQNPFNYEIVPWPRGGTGAAANASRSSSPLFHPVSKLPYNKLIRWQPTPVSLPGKSHGQRSLVSCSPWGCKESGMTEWLTLTYLNWFIDSMELFVSFFGLKMPSQFGGHFSFLLSCNTDCSTFI